MNWQAISFDWNQVRAFLATAEEGSLSAAARALGQTQPTVGRQISALEEALEVTLFERVGRSLVLAPAGRELLEHVRTMADAASRVSLVASGQNQAIEGRVRITASDVFCADLLIPAIATLRDIAPRLEIDVVAADDIRDLQRREADIAIRHVRPEQPELIARLVSEESARLYAARSYLERRGRPTTKEDLAQHDFVAFAEADRMIGFMKEFDIHLSRENFRLGSASGVVAWEMVKQGLGLSIMSDQVGRRAEGVEVVLPDLTPVVFPVWLVTHRELHTSRRIRLIYDHLSDHLTALGKEI